MFKAHVPGSDFSSEIIFAFHRRAGQTPEHGDLPDMRERIGDGGLQKSFCGRMQRLAGSEVVVEFFQGGKEAFNFVAPRQRCGVVPGLLALGDGKRPIKQIAHVREDLRGRTRFVADMKAPEMVGSAAEGFATTVSNGGDGMTKQLASGFG